MEKFPLFSTSLPITLLSYLQSLHRLFKEIGLPKYASVTNSESHTGWVLYFILLNSKKGTPCRDFLHQAVCLGKTSIRLFLIRFWNNIFWCTYSLSSNFYSRKNKAEKNGKTLQKLDLHRVKKRKIAQGFSKPLKDPTNVKMKAADAIQNYVIVLYVYVPKEAR